MQALEELQQGQCSLGSSLVLLASVEGGRHEELSAALLACLEIQDVSCWASLGVEAHVCDQLHGMRSVDDQLKTRVLD